MVVVSGEDRREAEPRNNEYNIRKSCSLMGVISSAMLKRPGARNATIYNIYTSSVPVETRIQAALAKAIILGLFPLLSRSIIASFIYGMHNDEH